MCDNTLILSPFENTEIRIQIIGKKSLQTHMSFNDVFIFLIVHTVCDIMIHIHFYKCLSSDY